MFISALANLFISAKANAVFDFDVDVDFNILTAFIRLGRAGPVGAGCPPYYYYYYYLTFYYFHRMTMNQIILNRQAILLLCLTVLIIPAPSSADGLSKSLSGAVSKDTVFNVWVFFNDRPASRDAARVSNRAALRRQRANFRAGESDRPVSGNYIREIERRGGKLRNAFAWGNAASFAVHASRLNEISSLPFVKSVSPVAVYVRRGVDNPGLSKTAASPLLEPGYGWHMEMVNVPMAHEYIEAKKLGDPGSGVYMAFFDGGFRLDHKAYARAVDSGLIAAAYDFVDGDTLVSDPDSVARDTLHAYHGNDKHGTQTLSLAAGYHPGFFMGAAWGARFALARTEDDGVESHVEEDNWAAAVVWAESLGVDIISSSLGYRDGFTDSTDYKYSDMDGKTTIISRAAAGAVARGMIVVNSMGNEGISNTNGTITAPADVDGVVSVGAVDRGRGLASFSSTGPTGGPVDSRRLKPDVVAPGVWVPLPDPYAPGLASYTNSNGTSFSAPIVSGILALIIQANPGISADEARARLYGSCSFAMRQTYVDNQHGYGIPNALLAMMGRDEIFVRFTDSVGRALAGAQVRGVGADTTYTVGESGCLLIKAKTLALPAEFRVSFRGTELTPLKVDSLPFTGSFRFDAARGDGFKVSPNVVKKNRVVRGKYFFSGTDFSGPAAATVTVRKLDGRKVWGQPLDVRADGSAEFAWDGARNVAPGVYFVIVRHGNNLVSERIVVGR